MVDGYGVNYDDYGYGDGGDNEGYGNTGGYYGSQYDGGEVNAHGNVVPGFVSVAGTPVHIQMQKRLSYEFKNSIILSYKLGQKWDYKSYYNKVKSKGEWDFKSRDLYKDIKDIESFGNFSFGATSVAWADGATFGISTYYSELTTNLVERGAGYYQENHQKYNSKNGNFTDLSSPAISNYGDQFIDQVNIGFGADYYHNNYEDGFRR